jgi:hypothetical protein
MLKGTLPYMYANATRTHGYKGALITMNNIL